MQRPRGALVQGLLLLLWLGSAAAEPAPPPDQELVRLQAGGDGEPLGPIDVLVTQDCAGTVTLHGLRIHAEAVTAALVDAAAGREEQLGLEMSYDQERGQWRVSASLGDAAAGLSRLSLHCRACASAASGAPFSGLLASGAVEGAEEGRAELTFVLLNAGPELLVRPPRRGAARALQQASNCTLDLGGAPIQFDGCTSVATSPMAIGYKLFFTLTPVSPGRTRWQGGLEAAAGEVHGQWAGFGVPAAVGQMLGANAVIVKQCKACASGASVDGYVLKDYVPSANVAGSWPLTDRAAAMGADGTLRATFTAEIPVSLQKLTAYPLNSIYAIGTVDASDNLLPHTTGTTPFGATKVSLKAA